MKPAGDVILKDEWSVESISHADAVACVESWHYAAGASNTSVARHGLFSLGGELCGAALWMPPTPAAGKAVAGDEWRGVLSLSRLVVAPDLPTNAASFLLGRSMRMVDRKRWPVLLTYADTRLGHTGAIYRATNWTDQGEVPAGDVWIGPDGQQRGRKRGGRNLTADEMRALGFRRAPNLPKRRFVHAC